MSLRERALGSLAGRLILSLSAAIIGSLAIWLFVFHILVRNELYGRFDDALVAHMHALAAYMVQSPGAEGIAEFMPEFRTQAHQDYFQAWDAAGKVLALSDSSAGRELPRLVAITASPTFYDIELPDGHRGRAALQNFAVPEGDARQLITIAMAAEITPLTELEQRLHLFILVCSLATVVVAVSIAFISIRRSLQPVERLSRSVSAIDLDNPGATLDIAELPRELKPVAGKIQVMTQKLIQALARERRFSRNVAHELRTPLAEARMLAEVGAIAENAEQARKSFDEIGKATQELEQIVEALLSLSRFESGIQKPEPEPVDLVTEIRRHADRLQGAARARGLALLLDVAEEAWVYVDVALVRRLLANLLGNAVAHAPVGATIHVRLLRDGSFSIDNPAPQLHEADLPHLGERFFRIHSGAGGTHAGLGLSLATAVARILGLKMQLSLTPEQHLVASVTGFKALPGQGGVSPAVR
jgi:two-component system sensor histidine kinase QseC